MGFPSYGSLASSENMAIEGFEARMYDQSWIWDPAMNPGAI